MLRLVLALLIGMLPAHGRADEYYEFYRVRCTSAIPSFEVQHTAYWNVRHVVWPTWQWQDHVAALKKLEQEERLFVFDQLYGYSDADKVEFICGPYVATITYDVIRRPKGPVGSEQPVRMNARITINSEKALVLNLPLRRFNELKVYADDQPNHYIHLCDGSACGSDLAEAIGPLTPMTTGKLIRK
jgi:hypothetical protein